MQYQLLSSIGLIALSITTSVAGQTVIKMGLSKSGAASQSLNISGLLGVIIQSPLILLGLGFYCIGALAWIATLSRLELSVAYPFLALNFVLVTLVSRFLLGESVPPLRWLGLVVICFGILFVARSTQS